MQNPPPERRKGWNAWDLAIRWLAGGGWLALFAALFLLDRARPQTETFFDRINKVPLRHAWNLALARYILYAMILGLVLSLAGIAINLGHYRRKEDELRLSLILIALIALAGIVKYFISFG